MEWPRMVVRGTTSNHASVPVGRMGSTGDRAARDSRAAAPASARHRQSSRENDDVLRGGSGLLRSGVKLPCFIRLDRSGALLSPGFATGSVLICTLCWTMLGVRAGVLIDSARASHARA